MTGLRRGQLTELSARVAAVIGDVVRPGGRGAAAGLFKSVAMVVTLLRTNITQEMAGDIFGCSQATVSRRWDLSGSPSLACRAAASTRARARGICLTW